MQLSRYFVKKYSSLIYTGRERKKTRSTNAIIISRDQLIEMTIAYASIEEAWPKRRKKSARSEKQDASCKSKTEQETDTSYDNVIDAYLDDFQSHAKFERSYDQPQRDQTQRFYANGINYNNGTDNKCGGLPEPLSDELYNMEYSQYYQENNMFPSSKIVQEEETYNHDPSSTYQEMPHTSQETQMVSYVPQHYQYPTTMEQHIDTSHLSHLSYNERPTSRNIFDLVLYVIAGIFLIFMLEQILQLGLYMRY